MKLTFTKLKDTCVDGLPLINAYLMFHGIYVRDRDIEVKYNEFHHFWDVRIFKCNRNMAGNGTAEWRAENWEHIQSRLKDLFPDSSIQDSWRWSHSFIYDGVECDEHCVPGVRLFIYCE